HRYGYIGVQDWSMYPLLHPGSLVIIDERQKKIVLSGWENEADRPIYFFEHRGGYSCGWASIVQNYLVVQPHPASQYAPVLYRYPNEAEVLGRVVGAAMFLGSKPQSPDRTDATRAASPGL